MSKKLTSTEIQVISDEKFGFFQFLRRDADSSYAFFFCSKHKTESRQYLRSHLQGFNPCKSCQNQYRRINRRIPVSEINKRLKEKFDVNIRFHSFDENSSKRAYFECLKHGRTSLKYLGNVLHINQRNNPCSTCSKEQRPSPKNKLKISDINGRLLAINSRLVFIRRKTGDSRYGIFRCRVHGHIKRALSITNILSQKISCPKCKTDRTPPPNKFSKKKIQELSDEVHGHFHYLGRSKADTNLGIFVCKTHIDKGIHKQYIANHIRGCNPCCGKISKGEQEIMTHLINSGFAFSQNKAFEECRNKNPLLFDFHIPDFNLLIEFDGEQHYRPIDRFGGKKKYDRLRKRDIMKTDFAAEKDFNFLRIPYTHINGVAGILEINIKKLNWGERVFKEIKPK